MINTFTQFGLIILIVLGVSFIMRFFKQPLIIGYIIAGVIVGPFFLDLIGQSETIITFSEMGIAFLLFIVGLHLSPKIIKEVGKISLVTGLGQIIFTSIIGYFIAIAFGFNFITSLYIAVALTFSSTIIIMKLLSDKEDLEKLYGKISIGFLLVQDIVAIIILVVISSFSTGTSEINALLLNLGKGLCFIFLMIPISRYLLPKLTNFFAKSQELLFLFSVSWGLSLSLLFLYLGLSVEVGALIAGVMLSMSPYSFEISSRLKPLRDFFIISFFIMLGSQMVFGDISNLLWPAVFFSLFILIGNPLVVMILMGLFGYGKKTGFMAGLTVAQISEFSLILIALGVKTGSLNQSILSFVTFVGLVTIAGSTYMIMYSDAIYKRISRFLGVFEKRKLSEKPIIEKEYSCILFGYNRIGFNILKSFRKFGRDYLIIDYNPDTAKRLHNLGENCIFGDADDSEIYEEVPLDNVKIVVSTIPSFETNMLIINKIKKKNKDAIIIVVSHRIEDTFEFYKHGATYVMMPHFLGGEHISSLIEEYKTNKAKFESEKKKHIKNLKERIKEGQEHPKIERHK